jgi:hypothetical protein
LATPEQIKYFFEIYREYRNNCVNTPWLEKTELPADLSKEVDKGWELGKRIKPNNPFRVESDRELALKAGKVLAGIRGGTELQFLHGHLSVNDLMRQGDEVVVFSNLFWKWRYPFYDAVFGYHWFIYSLNSVGGITPEQIEEQRGWWLEEIYGLATVDDYQSKNLINAALLEMAVAGLLLDSFAYIDANNPVAEYMISSTREQVKKMLL